ncbi:MAG: transhydrogenase subunit alpha [Marmoricola sp.]|nr:transhydrogenase subunit alpha [Marmoricola sp.]
MSPRVGGVKIAVVRETREGENRVALVPELVGRLIEQGHEVLVEPGAGERAEHDDASYAEVGATLAADTELLPRADVALSVNPLPAYRARYLRDGCATISFLPVSSSHDLVAELRDLRITAFAMELVPRISRAQSMDALSSQALVAGYRSAVVAAGLLRRFFPLNMTAAGTVQPAQVVVLGAGVAGLQAIATARRLGAVVRAYDVRAAAAEEIRSVGAKSIDLDLESLEGTGGYAREASEERATRQRELLAPYVADADALITTAAIPGRAAPRLVTREMVEQMRSGSVVVDLAAESGGNVEGSEPGRVVRIGHAQVWGGDNVPSQMPGPASRLYAQNVVNLLALMTHEGEFAPDFEDEVVAGACVTHDGRITHEQTRLAIEGPDRADPEPAPPTELLDLPPGPTDEPLDGPFEPSQEDDHR